MSWFTFRHEAMATSFQIAVAGHAEAYARQAAAAAFREIDRLEVELSRYVSSSDISRANRLGPGESIVISHDTLECLWIAADVSMATNGAFDAAYASTRTPGADPLTPVYVLDPAQHTLTSKAATLRLDVGAIGKGFALDRAADVLREWNVTEVCLVAGGSTVLALAAPGALNGWQVGIGDEPAVRTVPLAGAAVSASGTAVKGAHLVDPRTGRPAGRSSRAWAFAPTAAQSDALSTAFFVLTDSEVAAFCAAHPSIGAALARPDGTLVSHGALKALL